MTLVDHRLYFKELPFVHPTSIITVSLGLLTLAIVSSTHGQLVTLLPSVPLSPASCGPLALWFIAAHFDKLLLLWHHKGTSPGAHSNPFICIQVVLYSPTEKHASALQISMCLDLAPEGGGCTNSCGITHRDISSRNNSDLQHVSAQATLENSHGG